MRKVFNINHRVNEQREEEIFQMIQESSWWKRKQISVTKVDYDLFIMDERSKAKIMCLVKEGKILTKIQKNQEGTQIGSLAKRKSRIENEGSCLVRTLTHAMNFIFGVEDKEMNSQIDSIEQQMWIIKTIFKEEMKLKIPQEKRGISRQLEINRQVNNIRVLCRQQIIIIKENIEWIAKSNQVQYEKIVANVFEVIHNSIIKLQKKYNDDRGHGLIHDEKADFGVEFKCYGDEVRSEKLL